MKLHLPELRIKLLAAENWYFLLWWLSSPIWQHTVFHQTTGLYIPDYGSYFGLYCTVNKIHCSQFFLKGLHLLLLAWNSRFSIKRNCDYVFKRVCYWMLSILIANLIQSNKDTVLTRKFPIPAWSGLSIRNVCNQLREIFSWNKNPFSLHM
jgi:hypothetical protein